MDLYRLNGYKRKVINNGIIGNVYSGLNGGLIQRRYSDTTKGGLYINPQEGVIKDNIGVAPPTPPTPPTTGSSLLTPMLIIGGALAIKLLIK
jgi:hypothetical protein